jgi:uncharacterized FlgJ-related protein
VRRLFFLLAIFTSLLAAPAAQARMLYDDADLAVATVTMSHLPAWTQTVLSSVSLYASDDSTLPVTKLSRYTYLRVLGAGVARLEVQVYGDQGQPTQRGYVDADDVLPSAGATDWLVNTQDTPLFRSADAADPSRTVARFAALQLLPSNAQAGRIQVRVYKSDFTVLDQGWIDQSVTGPALAPQTRVAASDPALLRQSAAQANQQAFLDVVSSAARTAQSQTGVPASVTVAQAILESDWGRSSLAQNANNYFGIKAIGKLGSDGVVYMPTSEYNDSGDLYQTMSPFRAYKSLADSMTDHDRMLQLGARYARAMQAKSDPKAFAALLYEAGYSTDPAYADKLVALMDRYNLYGLDA